MLASFTACNKYSHAIAFSGNSFAFCSSRLLKVNSQLLKGHSGELTCLAFLQNGTFIVSGSSDKTLIMWKFIKNENRYMKHSILEGHAAGIVAVAAHNDMIVSSDSNSQILIWRIDVEGSVNLIQKLCLGSHHSLCLRLITLGESLLLFSGSTDCQIHVYMQINGIFEKTASLKGHCDWVKSIDICVVTASFKSYNSGDIMIASGSKDKYIRLWKLSRKTLQADFDKLQFDNNGGNLSTKAHVMKINGIDYSILLDAVLIGHDDWVHSVFWQPPRIKDDGEEYQPLVLASASADKTIIIWMPDTQSDSWVPRNKMGEIGGSTLGFYGARFSPDGKFLVGNGYHGSLHYWDTTLMDDGVCSSLIGSSGHAKSVEQVCWDPSGSYLLSCSLDQTCRVFASWNKIESTPYTWHEIARTQIHGYDLRSICFTNKYTYASGSDEKVIRLFEAPRFFAESLQNITKLQETKMLLDSRPIGANLPALGLSNKAVYEAGMTLDSYAAPIQPTGLSQPPLEEELLTATLWPEVDKLYGHGYEIVTVASNKQGTLIATSSKASKADHATIRIWSTETRKELCDPLHFHTLTVTGISFSNNGKYLLTAGRDRSWAFWDVETKKLKSSAPKAHARIIWKCQFTPDDKYFATASRDKLIKIWDTETFKLVSTLTYESSVTAMDIIILNDNYLFAVGFESGMISACFVDFDGNLKQKHFVDENESHALAVKSVAWRPLGKWCNGMDGEKSLMLASCSEDASIRIWSLLDFLIKGY